MEANEKMVSSDTENYSRKKKKSKGVTVWILVAVIIIALAEGIGFVISRGSAKNLPEQLELGQKYMEEMDYEQAVVTFSGIIEIDDQCVEAYLGLTETYIRMGEYDKALETAQKGYERTGDERLAEYIDMLESGNVMRSDGKIMKSTSYDADGTILFYHEFTYDKEGREESVTHYDSDHALVSSIDILYDKNGNKLSGYHSETTTGNLYKVENTYENGFLISEKIYYEDAVRINTYEYDDSGRVIKCAGCTDHGNGERTYGYELYQYDENGNRIRREHYYDNELTYYSTSEYQNGKRYKESYYDSDGELTGFTVFKKDGSYDYDGDGNLTGFTKDE